MKKLKVDKFRIGETKVPSGLSKSRRIIKTQLDKEIVFQKICENIKLVDLRSNRAESQRESRISKRK